MLDYMQYNYMQIMSNGRYTKHNRIWMRGFINFFSAATQKLFMHV